MLPHEVLLPGKAMACSHRLPKRGPDRADIYYGQMTLAKV